MKFRILSVVVILSVIAAMTATASPVHAVSYGTSFITSITYQNIDTINASIQIQFYSEANGTPITINRPDLAPNAGTSLYVGGLNDLTPGFRGSAVISSNAKLAATLVQIPPTGGAVKNRPLSNGFSGGASYVLIPTVLKNTFNQNSVFTVQNVDNVANDVTLTFVPVSGSPIDSPISNLPAGASKYIDMGSFAAISASTFNGSVKINAKQTGTANPGSVVATSMELSTLNNDVYAFEGATETGTKIYMPSAQCNFGPGSNTSTAYAVQNTTGGNVDVTVTYSNGHADGPYTLASGAKRSFSGCSAGNPTGFSGSSVVTATGNIVAVGKVFGGGLSTAFLGFASGAEKIALPYVRWTEAHWTDGTRQRAYIAIQNVGTSGLAAGTVTVKYYDKNGALVGTDTMGAINQGAKVNSTAHNIGATGYEFGAYPDGSFGGSAVVQGPAGSKLAVVVRIATFTGGTTMVAEDYNGLPIQ